jgi:hypothetical protein
MVRLVGGRGRNAFPSLRFPPGFPHLEQSARRASLNDGISVSGVSFMGGDGIEPPTSCL